MWRTPTQKGQANQPPGLPPTTLRLRCRFENNLVLSPRKTLAAPPATTIKGKANTSKKDEGRLQASGEPKRPPSAFFVFLTAFRQEYNAQHPDNKSNLALSKAAATKWRDMSEQEKQPYMDQAFQKKQAYWKTMEENDDDE